MQTLINTSKMIIEVIFISKNINIDTDFNAIGLNYFQFLQYL